jgi:hypothetical protein
MWFHEGKICSFTVVSRLGQNLLAEGFLIAELLLLVAKPSQAN